jgi:hypothetical protein
LGFFQDGDAIVVALTYGPDLDWLANLRAAGGGAVVSRGRTFNVGPPTVHTGLDQTTAIPAMVKLLLRVLRVSQFARLPLSADGKTASRESQVVSRKSPPLPARRERGRG